MDIRSSFSLESPEAKTAKEPLTYAQVFQRLPKDPWLELSSDEPLSSLHAEYWGKGILDDKRKWLEAQDGGHRMDTDEVPANFALYIDINGLKPRSLWVRKDYMLLYDACMAYFSRPRKSGTPPSVVLTGQPGVGTYHTLSSYSPLHFLITLL
jgi:hypothetical protein